MDVLQQKLIHYEIEEKRQLMIDMTKNNTFTSECVLKVSHELDTLILKVQKLYVGGER
ncbi:hypothetical protein KP78_15470 [Jeotgalibacillus soli]|uniref:Spo0E like sporulation regulatory protein n=1 Tax=Jeotgalibacillus soli TaxID=889306 RepID=A0A0C2S3B0_9BACL|nr:hypothetical protein KP78_15470 [Jeotgalibacillus soli]